jgi:hypothetical protein
MRANPSVLMAALALGVTAAALGAPVSSGGGSSSSGGFASSGGSSAGGASSSGSSNGSSSGGGGSVHGGGGGGGSGGGAAAGHGGGGGAAHAGGGWAGHDGSGAGRGSGVFAGVHPVFGMEGQRLPELHALTHGAAIAVLSQARPRPPHPTHPMHPLNPQPGRVIHTRYHAYCNTAFGCGPRDRDLFSNLYFCDPDAQPVPPTFDCRRIRKSKIEDLSHAGP